MIRRIRVNLSCSKSPEELHKELLDVSIVVHIRKGRHRRQDLDNLAKIILDALQKPKTEDGCPYLYENDNQIIRLLLVKKERTEYSDSETSQLSISARKHDPEKQMILKELSYN
jgi:Holliday junction resolvase RusA-like endonuclease